MASAAKLASLQKCKDQGNLAFKEGNTQEALMHYEILKKGLVSVEGIGGGQFPEEVVALRLSFYLNMAACLLKQARADDIPAAKKELKLQLVIDHCSSVRLHRRELLPRLRRAARICAGWGLGGGSGYCEKTS